MQHSSSSLHRKSGPNQPQAEAGPWALAQKELEVTKGSVWYYNCILFNIIPGASSRSMRLDRSPAAVWSLLGRLRWADRPVFACNAWNTLVGRIMRVGIPVITRDTGSPLYVGAVPQAWSNSYTYDSSVCHRLVAVSISFRYRIICWCHFKGKLNWFKNWSIGSCSLKNRLFVIVLLKSP